MTVDVVVSLAGMERAQSTGGAFTSPEHLVAEMDERLSAAAVALHNDASLRESAFRSTSAASGASVRRRTPFLDGLAPLVLPKSMDLRRLCPGLGVDDSTTGKDVLDEEEDDR